MLVIGLLFIATSIFAQGTLSGKITDADTGEPILFGDVVLYKNGNLITGEQTDFDGNYTISNIDAGSYDVVIKYVGYSDKKIENVLILDNQEININTSLKAGIVCGGGCGYSGYAIPLFQLDNFEKGQIFGSKQIRRMPNKK